MSFVAGQKVRASQMPGYVCTSTTRPSGHTGQTAYETDTGSVIVFDGTTWQYVSVTGGVATNAESNASSTQTVANITQTVVAFGTNNRTTTLVTKATQGAGHRFTLNRSGVWAVTTCVRWSSAAVAGERYVLINSSDGGLCSQGQVMSATSSPLTLSPSVTRYFGAGSWVQIEAYQGTGGSRDLEFNNSSGWGRLALSWVHA